MTSATMKLEVKDSANYAAVVVRVPPTFALPNADKLVGMSVFGYTVVGDLSWIDMVGELAIFFPAEAQLSDAFVAANNLYRHTDLNSNPTKSGYLEDNRRVRALKLRGTVSNGLMMPVSSLDPLGLDWSSLSPGDIFDAIDGIEICRKYRVKEPQVHDPAARKIAKAFKRVDATMLPEHIETDQWLRNEFKVGDDAELIVTQKLHGTSVRLANTLVRRKLGWLERLAVKLGINVPEYEYDLVAGSRKSIKDPNNPDQQHFYGEGGDVWTEALRSFGDRIPPGFIIYGELVGFTGTGAPIQKGHTYEAPPGEMHLYVYRVAFLNKDGMMVDLHWDAARKFCAERGLEPVPTLARTKKRDFRVEDYDEKAFAEVHHGSLSAYGHSPYLEEPVRLSVGGTGKDEGIAIRVDSGLIPELYKYKNKSHYLYETAQLDSGEVDLESGG